MFADLALRKLLTDKRFRGFETVLDIGSGPGEHARVMRHAGKTVTTLDVNNPAASVHLDFSAYFWQGLTDPDRATFDAIWCSHVLEHQPDVQDFLFGVRELLNDRGVLAITVPPAKHEIVGGHLSIWNAGLLLYNLVMAGFDCTEAAVCSYGYNISVILRKTTIELPDLKHDHGDLNTLAEYFPPMARGERFNGDIKELNW